MIRSTLAVALVALAAVSFSGAAAQPMEPMGTGIPAPRFGEPASGPFSPARIEARAQPLGPGAPAWARRLHRDSLRVLVALTDSRSGGQIAGARERWDYVWPRDAAAGAIALQAAGLRSEAQRVAGFLAELNLDAARFEAGGEPVPGRPPAGDAQGWVAVAARATGIEGTPRDGDWQGRQDYGENLTGDLLGNALAAGAPSEEIIRRFLTRRGLVRREGTEALDSSAAWAVAPFAVPGMRESARRTLLALTRGAGRFGIAPIEGWSPGEAWTAPTAWSAWALVELGEIEAADRLLAGLRRATTPAGTLPERVSSADGRPTSTTPLAWSHAFAILALRARY